MSDAYEVDPTILVTSHHLPSHDGWIVTRVYSEYTSREIFHDPEGVEWVRVSATSFNPERGDIELQMKTRGLAPMRLRRRDALAANLKGND